MELSFTAKIMLELSSITKVKPKVAPSLDQLPRKPQNYGPRSVHTQDPFSDRPYLNNTLLIHYPIFIPKT